MRIVTPLAAGVLLLAGLAGPATAASTPPPVVSNVCRNSSTASLSAAAVSSDSCWVSRIAW